ncbi:zinc transporter [Fusarium heterosporum]|uniref:Zinc transporter n=1 Tax=Fusarium heterosporum TaxID=42747 RepID=A0A8H5WRX4_FUSHE|nr:zinc transporter [Fusarium heterosporum]
MHSSALSLARWGLLFAAAASTSTAASTQAPSSTAASAPEVTAITGCHLHASELYCFAGETEYLVDVKVTATTDVPSQYTDCHSHGSDMFCVDSDGGDVSVQAEGAESEEGHAHEEGKDHDHDHDHAAESATGTGDAAAAAAENTAEAGSNEHCHFHAGVEHCTGGSGHGHGESESGESESGSASSACQPRRRDYNIGLRIGLLFVILATGALGVFGPILLQKMMPSSLSLVLLVLKQFGTGIIISTAFVHLYTHAFLMFSNQCIGELGYEATTSAIVMAGIFLSFLVEYIGNRIVLAKTKASSVLSADRRKDAWLSAEVVSVLVMELGILFHSLLIGLTLVVAGDEYFLTLFVVILFHQMFEGIALGSRIATIGTAADVHAAHTPVPRPSQDTSSAQDSDKAPPASTETIPNEEQAPVGLTMKKKLGLASLFAFITPIGMAIGIGVLQQFNGNDKSTLLAIGTLDALSAGILMWVGLVEMWAADWMTGGHGHKAELAEANMLTTILAGFGLVAGLLVMSLLGKWA